MQYKECEEFKKELKKIAKKYKSFDKDYHNFLLIVKNDDTFRTQIFSNSVSIKNIGVKHDFFKLKKFRSRDLKSSDSFRVIYFIINDKIFLIEIYPKNNSKSSKSFASANHNLDRIKRYIAKYE
ncbi:hypothetical protein D4R87_00435 [bacterium]|nr:MAG: hypothetical protein D4R87_00435 [bacterium]